MRRIQNLARAASLLSTAHLAATAGGMDLSHLPTSGPVLARVMQIGIPREAQATAQTIQTAFQSQPQWAKLFLSKAAPGQPLPYHPNMGVTEDQYNSLLLAAEAPSLIEVARVTLSAVRQANGEILLTTEPPTSRVNGIVISPDAKSVTTPLAPLSAVSSIDNQNAKGATGRWAGTQWSIGSGDAAGRLSVKFAVGKRPDFGDSIVFYDVKDSRSIPGRAYYEVLLFRPGK